MTADIAPIDSDSDIYRDGCGQSLPMVTVAIRQSNIDRMD
jgi:hypothetical protein